ncbi:MAG: protein TolR [Acidobacteria bacterium]|nr:MAG: protein TolR [Acidobacteriota bacterium]PIE89894.1 MAG: protein TolR [Acidobacteriota bacterium]
MGFSTGRGPSSNMSEINVTPLVDVMLVLLIVFMISAPLLQSGVDVDLPVGNFETEVNENNLILSIDAEGKHYLGETYLQPGIIIEKVKAAVATSKNKTVYIRGDKNLRYGQVMEFLEHLRKGGIEQVSLVMEPVQEK